MNKFLCILSLFFACSCFAQAFNQDRIYINSKDVLIGDNGIFVNLNGHVMQINGLFKDEVGLYTENDLVPDLVSWYCITCEEHRLVWQDPCPYCKSPKPKCK